MDPFAILKACAGIEPDRPASPAPARPLPAVEPANEVPRNLPDVADDGFEDICIALDRAAARRPLPEGVYPVIVFSDVYMKHRALFQHWTIIRFVCRLRDPMVCDAVIYKLWDALYEARCCTSSGLVFFPPPISNAVPAQQKLVMLAGIPCRATLSYSYQDLTMILTLDLVVCEKSKLGFFA